MTTNTGRKRGGGRRRRTALKVTALGAAVLVLGRVVPAEADSLSWDDEGDTFASFGPNASVTISLGQISFIRGCAIGDFVTAFTDVYIVPHGSVSLGANLPAVAIGGPHVIGSTAAGGLFIDESLGFTKPGGLIPAGVYDVVYDNCQDGAFDAQDTLFSPAFSVTVPADVPAEPSAAIAEAKARAEERLVHYEELHQDAEQMFLAFKAMEIMLALTNVHTAEHFPVPHPDPGDTFFFFFNLVGPLAVYEHQALNEIVQTIRHYQALVDDPPDPNFKQTTFLDARDTINIGSGAPTDFAAAGLGENVSTEGALIHALRVSLERYSGARAAKDLDWALVHARAAGTYARQATAQIAATGNAAAALGTALSADGAPIDEALAQLETIRSRWVTAGLTADERGQLRSLGQTDAQIDQLVADLGSRTFTGTKAGTLATLATVQGTAASLVTALQALATAEDTIVTTLVGSGAVANASPIASAGGTYTGTEGVAVSFDASASRSPGAITKYEWDLDGDGLFTDASGATPSFTYHAPFEGLVGVRVTNASGLVGVAYAPAHIADANHAPTISGVSPDPRRARITAGAAQSFGVTPVDPEGDPITIQWAVDGVNVATGATFLYQPAAAALGLHTITAAVSDSNPLGGTVLTSWDTLVVAPDQTSPASDPPAAQPDVATVAEDGTVVLDPTANDVAAPGAGPLALHTITPASHGTAAIVGGRLSYVPAANYNGPDLVGYTVCNAATPGSTSDPLCASSTVTIDVTPVDDAPLATGASIALVEDSAGVAVDLGALVSDVETPAAALTYQIVAGPAKGTLAGAGPVFTYRPNANTNGTDSFTYRVFDSGDPAGCGVAGPHCASPLASAPQTINLVIAPVNDAPSVSLDAAGPVAEGASITLTASAHDIEAEDGEGGALSYTWIAEGGTLVPSVDGRTATFTADDGPASAVIQVLVSDGQLQASDVRAIEVVNVAPVATAANDSPSFWGLPVHFQGTVADPSAADRAAGLAPTWTFDADVRHDLDVSEVFDLPGSYTATFEAADKDGGLAVVTTSATVIRRPTALALAAPATSTGAFSTVAATLTDTVDAGTARLAGHAVVFSIDGVAQPAVTTDATGVATLTLATATAPVAHTLVASFAGDTLYLASSATGSVSAPGTGGGNGKMSGTDLRGMLCGRGAFNVQSAGGVLSGELQWRKSDGVFHARTISTLTIASDGRSGSFTGIGDDGRPFEVYVEASGGKGSHDIFKLTVGGVLQTRSDGALAGGEIRICPDSVQAAL